MVRSDEDDSYALPKRLTNEDVARMRCRSAADIASTYSIHAIQYSAMRQYTSAQKDTWPSNRIDGSFTGNSDTASIMETAIRCRDLRNDCWRASKPQVLPKFNPRSVVV